MSLGLRSGTIPAPKWTVHPEGQKKVVGERANVARSPGWCQASKAQKGPEALYSMVFGDRNRKTCKSLEPLGLSSVV